MTFGDDSNEGYPDGEEPLHYYYNREERLAHAPKIVKDYYNGAGPKVTRGLFKNLVSTRSDRFILGTLVACLVLVLFLSFFGNKSYRAVIGGVTAELSAFSYDDMVYVSIHFSPSSKVPAAVVSVEAVVSALDTDNQITAKKTMTGKYDGKEDFIRTKFSDYDIINISAVVSIAGESKTLKSTIEKR